MEYGYARVSTREQNDERQRIALTAFGITPRAIFVDKQSAIVVLDMPLLDTRRSRNLTGTLIADTVLQLLSYVAQAEGIAAAKERGVRFGRPQSSRPTGFPAVLQRWRGSELSARQAAEQLNITHKTFLRWAGLLTYAAPPDRKNAPSDIKSAPSDGRGTF